MNKKILLPAFAYLSIAFIICIASNRSNAFQEKYRHSKISLRTDKQYLLNAEQYFDPKLKKVFQSKHYTVIADHPDPLAPENIAKAFESFRQSYSSIFGKVFPLRKVEYMTYILLFKGENSYYYYCLKVGMKNVGKTAGQYIFGTNIIISHFRQASSRDLIAVLIHEGVHQLNDQLLYSKNVRHSIWVEEGMANYFALAKLDKKDILSLDKIDSKSRRSGEYINKLKRAIKKDKHIKIQDLIACENRNAFYGEKSDIYYAESWLLVHFMLHYNEGKYRKHFTEFLHYEIEGMGGLRNFRKVFREDLESLEKEFYRYVRKL